MPTPDPSSTFPSARHCAGELVDGTGATLAPRLRQLAWHGATAIHDAFDDYQAQFRAITRRAQQRFEHREWHHWQADSIERLELYEQVLRGVVTGLAHAAWAAKRSTRRSGVPSS